MPRPAFGVPDEISRTLTDCTLRPRLCSTPANGYLLCQPGPRTRRLPPIAASHLRVSDSPLSCQLAPIPETTITVVRRTRTSNSRQWHRTSSRGSRRLRNRRHPRTRPSGCDSSSLLLGNRGHEDLGCTARLVSVNSRHPPRNQHQSDSCRERTRSRSLTCREIRDRRTSGPSDNRYRQHIDRTCRSSQLGLSTPRTDRRLRHRRNRRHLGMSIATKRKRSNSH